MSTQTEIYYFDGSDDAPSDPDNKWNDEAGIAVWDMLLVDEYPAEDNAPAKASDASTKTSGYLHVGGVNCAEYGPPITQVRVRAFCWINAATTLAVTVYADGNTEELGTTTMTSTTKEFSPWATLAEPSGGWTWPKIAALEARVYASSNYLWIYYIQLEVTTEATFSLFYFDASDDAVADPNSAWSDDANCVDGNYTNVSTCGIDGNTTANYLFAGGTGASGIDTIYRVRARLKGYAYAPGTMNAAIYSA